MDSNDKLILYRFLVKNSEQMETRERIGKDTEYLAWVYLWAIQDLVNMLRDLGVDFSINSIEVQLQEHTLCINLADMLDSGDLADVFKK